MSVQTRIGATSVMVRLLTLSLMLLIPALQPLSAQVKTTTSSGWQQAVHYTMDIDVDADRHQYKGTQTLRYTNNSPDTLHKAYYHLYFNAFQPNSMMDIRSRTIADPDRRVGDRIQALKEDEYGWIRVRSLQKNGKPVQFTEEGTILVVRFEDPILPGQTAELTMAYDAQVPLQIRRSGRDSAEGVEFSMAQWYPKISAYDEDGWHPNPYIGREFYAPFGTFEVTIHIDRDYVVAGTGVLQNPDQVGYGYEAPGTKVRRPRGDKLTWSFRAENVHDFMWAADPDYIQSTYQVPNGPLLRFFHQGPVVATNAKPEDQARLLDAWSKLPEYTSRAFEYANRVFGQYPYPEYMVIQGGDGGMEYIMGTLITGNRSLQSLVGVTVHEFMHSWYQGVIGLNESYYYWMDEGFTSYATDEIMATLFGGSPLSGYRGTIALARSGREEPMSTHADHFMTNGAYGLAAYSKGAVFLGQMAYIIGKPAFDRVMLDFFNEWKFRHPTGLDLLRMFERESDMELDWYYEYFVHTTKSVDYGIATVESKGGAEPTSAGAGTSDTPVAATRVTLSRNGDFPMPLDIEVAYKDGSTHTFYIPLRLMRGEKPAEGDTTARTTLEDWVWVAPTYSFDIPRPISEISTITIDPSMRLADIERADNTWPADAD